MKSRSEGEGAVAGFEGGRPGRSPFRAWLLTVLPLVCFPGAPAGAQDEAPNGAPKAVSELRLGVMRHGVHVFVDAEEPGVDVNAEVLFASPDFLRVLWSPRPHLGGSLNTSGDTSQLYFGLTWDVDLFDPVFFEASFGGAVHDGETNDDSQGRKALGCRVLFRESLALGWRLDARHSLSVMLDHISNGQLCDHNEGLDTLGLRYGYRF